MVIRRWVAIGVLVYSPRIVIVSGSGALELPASIRGSLHVAVAGSPSTMPFGCHIPSTVERHDECLSCSNGPFSVLI